LARGRSDRILGLCWIVYGTAGLSIAAYQYAGLWPRGGRPEDLVWLLPTAAFRLILIIGGIGIALGRRWAWIIILLVSLLSALSSGLALRAFVFAIWPRGVVFTEVLRTLVPTIAQWSFTVWTAVRFFSRPKPWQTARATGSLS
jgi:membrane-associated phospholipid phosphatase